ncbi:hypothetical protein QBC43DRAFT_100281 [Cladorrhinum sp. PSN259]|nr:hypothetical protein QBC43DRAFT_100281 [Cladorrhinum sp. PSN259]
MAQTQPQNPPLRRFACPFFKANPRYAVSTRCTETGWVRIDHLKRHIRLVHVRDEKDCSQDLSEPEEAFITDFEKVALPAGFGNRSGEEAWRHMYKVLFPSAETVPSPCKSEPIPH